MRKNYIVIGGIVFLVTVAAILIYLHHYSIISSHEGERNSRYQKIELSFKKNPNIRDGAQLIEYYFGREDLQKALFYANACIDLGVNNTPVGYNVNFNIAQIYHRLNNMEMATKHLKTALELDKEGVIIGNNWLKKAGMQELLE